MPDEVDRIFAEAGVGADPWSSPEARPEPSNFIALWPLRNMPTLKEVTSALNRQFGHPLRALDIDMPPDRAVQWAQVLDRGDGRMPLIVWCEPMRPLPKETIDFIGAGHIKWVIGVETILDPNDPLSDFMSVLRALGRGIAQSPAILNVNTECWHVRSELDEVILPDVPGPDETILWVTHAISPKEDDDARLWVYTKGLRRCGLPELEMLDVPLEFGRSAAAIVNHLAPLLIEDGMPEPGEQLEIGREMRIVLQPWRIAAKGLAGDVPGGENNRVDHTDHPQSAPSAAVCAAEQSADGRWVWPEAAVRRVASGETALYFSGRATQRLAGTARSTWSELKDAFNAVPESLRLDNEKRRAAFLICAAFTAGTARDAENPDPREHLWFEALRFENDRVEGRLQNAPSVATHLRHGEVVWIDRETLTDWAVLTEHGRVGPLSAGGLRTTVEKLLKVEHA